MQDGVLRIGADIGAKERAPLLESTREASSWKQAKRRHAADEGDEAFKHDARKGHGMNNEEESVLTCINVFVAPRLLCSGSICALESRAAEVGQGHVSIIDLPSQVTAYYGLSDHEDRFIQS